jgi:hypothetical protein
MDEVENFFCQFPNPWALRVSGMGGYTSKCEKKSKSLHPTGQPPRESVQRSLPVSGVIQIYVLLQLCHWL